MYTEQKTLFTTLKSQASMVRLKQRYGLYWIKDTDHHSAPAVISAVKNFAKAALRNNCKHIKSNQGMYSNAALLRAARTGRFHHLPGWATNLVLSFR
jgi:hypothetical protein